MLGRHCKKPRSRGLLRFRGGLARAHNMTPGDRCRPNVGKSIALRQ